MPIVGSVQATLSAGNNTVTLPYAGLTVVAIWHTAPYVKIPIDSSRFAILPNTGYVGATPISTATMGYRKVTFTVNGTALNVYSPGSATINVYYGSALSNAKPLTAFAAVTAQVTLSSGAGTASLTFPAGNLTMTGIAASDETTSAQNEYLSWSTSSGQLLNYSQNYNAVSPADNDTDIFPLQLPVAQTLSVTIAGHGSDVIDVYAFYQ